MSDDCEHRNGRVVRLKGGTAYVEIVKSAECNGCKACVFGAKGDRLVLPARNDLLAAVGDRVEIIPPPPRPVFAFVMLFVLPLAALLVGLFIARAVTASEPWIIAGAAIGLGAGLSAVFAAEKLVFSKKYVTKIISVQRGEQNNG